jgi:phosphatidylserine/phosphatidylglycerophosphate/cardiolipin synthase-like enzyme
MNRLTLSLATLLACGAPSQADLDQTRGGRADVFFNEPGTRQQNMWEPDVIDVMIEAIDGATASIDFAVMGFNRMEVIKAFERAHDRGVKVRMVGDSGHLYNNGYNLFRDRQIPMVVGNQNHIMHNKFMVVDDRFVFGGTANWTDTDLRHNSNNFFLIDSPAIAADFTAEFEQMFSGLFGHMKKEIENGRFYQVGDTLVEVWFAPNEDAMGRILELVDAAEDSIRFTIFAFTKDQVGSAYIRKQAEFAAKDAAEGITCEDNPLDCRTVAGMIDQSQLHSNGQYHEVFRLLGAEIPLRMDSNDNSQQPGDYQAGGGRLHSKTMVLDAEGERPIVITGSFNWSSSATVSNDEYLLIFHGVDGDGNRNNRVAAEFDKYFNDLWHDGRRMGRNWVGEDGIEEGDLVINEVMWFGQHDGDPDGNDEYIELRNLSDQPIVLDLWQIANANDFVVGLPPGSVIEPNGLFTILDHTRELYQDGVPQDELSAFRNGDLVVNAFNDNRQARLYIKDGNLDLRLKDPTGRVVDRAGDGGPAYYGGPADMATTEGTRNVIRSMERRADPGDGVDPDSWYSYTLELGGDNVNEDFKELMLGSPGETNSPEAPPTRR